MAGGHSLLPVMKQRLAQPSALIDLALVEGMSGVEQKGRSVAPTFLRTKYYGLLSHVGLEGVPDPPALDPPLYAHARIELLVHIY